ncbi:hypothetical protein [Paraburkholderia bonniea]|uniref:hypothetical protein n=1 Tax=Paraburkholderia bonniea TaxID=2152891 RepID=UPI00129128ED|nr:hypothetical protein [Paraburkholderia bonniea]
MSLTVSPNLSRTNSSSSIAPPVANTNSSTEKTISSYLTDLVGEAAENNNILITRVIRDKIFGTNPGEDYDRNLLVKNEGGSLYHLTEKGTQVFFALALLHHDGCINPENGEVDIKFTTSIIRHFLAQDIVSINQNAAKNIKYNINNDGKIYFNGVTGDSFDVSAIRPNIQRAREIAKLEKPVEFEIDLDTPDIASSEKLADCRQIVIGDGHGNALLMAKKIGAAGYLGSAAESIEQFNQSIKIIHDKFEKISYREINNVNQKLNTVSEKIIEKKDLLKKESDLPFYKRKFGKIDSLTAEMQTLEQEKKDFLDDKKTTLDQIITDLTQYDIHLSLAFRKNLDQATNASPANPDANIDVIFLGDTTNDCGPNDLATISFFKLLKNNNINYKIIFSNHDLNFLRFFLKIEHIPDNESYAAIFNNPNMLDMQGKSLQIAAEILDHDVSLRRDFKNKVRQFYMPHLLMMAISENDAKLLTHAPVNELIFTRILDDVAARYFNTSAQKTEFNTLSWEEKIRYINKFLLEVILVSFESLGTYFPTINRVNSKLHSMGVDQSEPIKNNEADNLPSFHWLAAVCGQGFSTPGDMNFIHEFTGNAVLPSPNHGNVHGHTVKAMDNWQVQDHFKKAFTDLDETMKKSDFSSLADFSNCSMKKSTWNLSAQSLPYFLFSATRHLPGFAAYLSKNENSSLKIGAAFINFAKEKAPEISGKFDDYFVEDIQTIDHVAPSQIEANSLYNAVLDSLDAEANNRALIPGHENVACIHSIDSPLGKGNENRKQNVLVYAPGTGSAVH